VEDDYWRHGSVIGQYDRIQAAAFLIGGWHDGYPNPPLRTYRALTCPKKLLMGPWSHAYPDVSHCGPRIRINHELVRWWDRWLKGIPNGVDEEPPVQVFVQEFEQPRRDRQAIAGRWHCAAELPPEEASRAFFAGSGSLANEPSDASGSETFDYRPGSAQNGIIWDGGIPFCQAGDQRADEAHAINYTSEPLTEDMVVFGQARVELTVSADVPVLPLACRISEVAPDGTSVLTARGILNLTRREGMDHAVAVRPGEPMRIALDLEANAWRFRAGHRIRLTLDGSDFPNVWPTPCSGSGTVIRSAELPAVLSLPVWHAPEPLPFEFLPSDAPANNPHGSGDPPAWRVVHDVLEDRYHFLTAAGNEFSVSDQDPARAYTRAKSVATASWPGMNIRAEATAALNSDPRSFHLVLSLSVYVNDTLHAQRDWRQSVERHLM
jgi:putative CocE/NonD family hydrolase